MELEPSPPASLVPTRTASGGPRSCMTCAKAKAKCVRVDGERVCQRCARLEKECYMKEPVARRRKIVKPTRAAQLEKLESKIEHLVKALSTKQAGHQPESSQLSPPNSQDDPTSTRVSEVVSALTACDPGCACHGDDHSRAKVSRYIAGLDGGLVQQPHCHMDDFSAVGVTKVEAEMLLQRFRGLMAHSMPFVRIPAEATAQELYDTKPVLLHAIVMVASFHDQTLQQILLKRFMQHIAERTLVNCEKSLSIVQGILVVINWYHPHLLGRPQITLLLHLASGLAEELGIERFPHTCSENPRPEYKLSKRRVPTFEEHRVICGLFYLTSMFSGCFRKVNAMSWSPYLEHCVNELEQARQFEADMLLVELVRSQYLIERTTALQSRQGGAPTHMFINALKADLDALKQRALYADQENILLQMQHLVAEVHIYGLSLMDIIENDKSSLPAQLDNLFMLISKSKSLFATFYRVPIQDYLIMPFAVFGQYAHSFITYTRLASLEVDGWDTKHLRSEMQFAANVEESLAHFDAAINCGPQGIAVKNEVFAKWSYRLRWMKGIYESRSVESQCQDVEDADVAVAQQGLTGEQDPASAVDQHYQQPTPPDDLLSSDLFSYLDDSFWQGFPVGFDDSFRDLPMQTQPSISKQGLMQQGLLPPVTSTDHLEYEQTRYYR